MLFLSNYLVGGKNAGGEAIILLIRPLFNYVLLYFPCFASSLSPSYKESPTPIILYDRESTLLSKSFTLGFNCLIRMPRNLSL